MTAIEFDAEVPALAAGTAGAEVHETHSGIVVLLGEFAYKTKKPVDLGFLDFRTPEARVLACRRELELNRRLAPDVYLDVATFTRSACADEPVLVMRRMPGDTRLATMVTRGAEVGGELHTIAARMAAFHAGADRNAAISVAAGPTGLRRRWQDNLREIAPLTGSVLDEDLCHQIGRLALRFVDGRTPLLTERVEAGHAVDGHGDLLAEDVFCLPDGPRILDCLEFDDQLRWVDEIDDVAFLAMDLERLGTAKLSSTLFDAYVEYSGVGVVPSLWHHYIAYRAFVRAKVEAIRCAQGQTDTGAAEDFARMALRHLETSEVRLILVGGAPGTGKTTLASAIADRTGATMVSSDTIRQEQDLPAATRYGAAAKNATYQTMLERARHLLERGESVVADATWSDAAWRRQARELAASTLSRQILLECETPIEQAADRAERRLLAGTDQSEAGADISRALASHRDPWPEASRVDTSGPPDVSIRQALLMLGVAATP